jgi:hypothetical protein
VRYLEEEFSSAEFRRDQTWRKAMDMDSTVIGEMLKASRLEKRGYILAPKDETKLQIRWRMNGDWRAGSVPEGPEMIVQGDYGAIGGR